MSLSLGWIPIILVFVILLLVPSWATLRIIRRTDRVWQTKTYNELTSEEKKKADLSFRHSRLVEVVQNALSMVIFFGIMIGGLIGLRSINLLPSIQENLVYGSRLPLLIQYNWGMFYVALIPFAFTYTVIFLFLFEYAIYHKNWDLYVLYISEKSIAKHNVDYFGGFRKALSMYKIILVGSLIIGAIGVTYGIDDYFIANNEGIYLNNYDSFGIEKFYNRQEVKQIVIDVTPSSNPGSSGDLYIIMDDGHRIFLDASCEQTVTYIKIIREKSGARVFTTKNDFRTLEPLLDEKRTNLLFELQGVLPRCDIYRP